MKKIKKLLFFSACIMGAVVMAFPCAKVCALPDASSAKAMCVIEQTTGRVLFGKNEHLQLPMASTTKIFTALTVLENCNNLQEKVHIDDRAVGIEGTSIYLRKGEVLSVQELLLGMMLPSGNDAAAALMYHVGKTQENFCKMMQKTAQNAGAKNSSFCNAHGLDQNGHYTTAYDLAMVSAKALQNPKFLEISTTKSAVISGNNEVKSRYLKNKNRLLKNFEGCTGVKTGFTDNAGRCFVASAKRGDLGVVCSVLNCPDMFEEAARLMDNAYGKYSFVPLVQSYGALGEVNVENGRQSTVKIFSRRQFGFPLSQEEQLKTRVVIDVPKTVCAPVAKEQVLGKLKVYFEDKVIFEDDILAREQVLGSSLADFLQEIAKFWNYSNLRA